MWQHKFFFVLSDTVIRHQWSPAIDQGPQYLMEKYGTPSAPCELHEVHSFGRNSLSFEHDWMETYHPLHFVLKIFLMYTLYVQNIT